MNPNIVNAWGFFFDMDTIVIRKDNEGRYCLNDLHKAAGGLEKHKPVQFFRQQQAADLITEIKVGNPTISPVVTKLGCTGGTFVCKELVTEPQKDTKSYILVKTRGRTGGTYVCKKLVAKPAICFAFCA